MFGRLGLAAALSLLLVTVPRAQEAWPERAVSLVVGYSAGGGMDAAARILAPRLAKAVGGEVVVENHPGASSTRAAAKVKGAEADGHTILLAETGMYVGPVLYPRAGYDAVKDFSVIGRVGDTAMVLTVPAASPFKTLKDVIEAARAEPGKLDYGTPGVGTVHHLVVERMKRIESLEITHVPYKGGAPVLSALLSGEIPLGVMSITAAMKQAEAGKIRMIASTDIVRSTFAPDVPTFAETVPGFGAPSGIYLLAPAGLPDTVKARLRDALDSALSTPDAAPAFARIGSTLETPAPDKDYDALYAETVGGWQDLARAVGAKAE